MPPLSLGRSPGPSLPGCVSCLFIAISFHSLLCSSLPILGPLFLLESPVIPFCLAYSYSWVPIDITSPGKPLNPQTLGWEALPGISRVLCTSFRCLLFLYPGLILLFLFPTHDYHLHEDRGCLLVLTVLPPGLRTNLRIDKKLKSIRGIFRTEELFFLMCWKIRLSYLVMETCLTGTSDKRDLISLIY